MRKTLVLGTLTASLVGVGLVAGPASADACTVSTTCASTTVATTVGAGTLAIAAVPVSAPLTFTNSLPNSGTSQSIGSSADLTLTTVTDTRLTGTGWAVTANMTDLSGVPSGSIAKNNVKLSVAAAAVTKVLGSAGMLVTGSSPTAANATSGDVPGLITASSTGGLNTVTYTPHVDITVPAGTVAGVYTGTLTQSVA